MGLAPRDETVGERTRPGQHLVEAPVRVDEDLLVGPGRTHPVAGLDLVRVTERLPRQFPRCGEETPDLRVQPVATTGRGSLFLCRGRLHPFEGFTRVDRGEQPAGRRNELLGILHGLRVDRRGECTRSVVGVDQPVDVASDAETEDEVRLDETCSVLHGHSLLNERPTSRGAGP